MPKLKYETNDGVIGLTNVSTRAGYVAAYGTPPVAAASAGVYFRKSGSRRAAGVQTRFLICSRNDGPVTPGGSQPKKYAYPTVGTLAAFNAVAIGSTINLSGNAYTVDDKKGEG